MTSKCARSCAIATGSSWLSSQTPSGTITSPVAGTATRLPSAPGLSSSQGSLAIFLSLMMSAIDAFLEGFDANAPHDVDEAFALAVALLEVGSDQLLDHVGNLLARKRRADYLSDRRRRPGAREPLVAADADLVPLLAVLVDAENADVTDVVMPAGIHAAGNVEVQLADVVDVVQAVEALLDRLRHWDGLGIRKRAEIAAGAGDNVGNEPDVSRGEAQSLRLLPQGVQVRLAHIGQNQVLLVGNPQLALAVAVGEVRHRVHLGISGVARRNAGLLERQ